MGPARLHLATGMYAGPFELPAGAELIGEGTVVLHGDGPHVVRSRGQVRLVALHVQGGEKGLEVHGTAALQRVTFAGQRGMAIHVAAAGRVELRESHIEGTLSAARGVVAAKEAVVLVDTSRFVGPLARGVDAPEGGSVTVTGTRFEGPVVGLRKLGGRLAVAQSSFVGGRGAALHASGAAVDVADVDVLGHEVALELGQETVARVRRFTSTRADRAGIASVKARLELRDATVVDSGSFGGLQLLESRTTVERVWLHRPLATGILVRKGEADLHDVVVSGVRDEAGSPGSAGDALHVRDAKVSATGLTVLGAAGVGVLASTGAAVRLTDVHLQGCQVAGVLAELQAQVRGTSIRMANCASAAVAVPSAASVQLDGLDIRGCSRAVWAECSAGAEVSVGRYRGEEALDASSCVEVRPRPTGGRDSGR